MASAGGGNGAGFSNACGGGGSCGGERRDINAARAAHTGGGGGEADGKVKAKKIDKLSRKIFPVAFVVFNIVYWIYYSVLFNSDQPA